MEQYKSSFWDISFSKIEQRALLLQMILCIVLHLSPISNSGLYLPLTILMAGIGFWVPTTGFFFIAATQYLPYPEASQNNPAMIAPFVWIVVVLIRFRKFNLNGISIIWPFFVWYIWAKIAALFYFGNMDLEWLKCILYLLISIQLINESKGNYLKCLFTLLLGAFFISTAFWGAKFGLPIEINTYGNEREGFERLGGARADSVMLWPPLLIAIGGLVGMMLAFSHQNNHTVPPKWFTRYMPWIILLAIPPLLTSMANGAFLGLTIMIVVIFIWILYGYLRRAFKPKSINNLVSILMIWLFLGLFAWNLDFLEMKSRTTAFNFIFDNQQDELGSAGSRTDVWEASIKTILTYPLLGLPPGEKEIIPIQYQERGYFLSHNMFLDMGRGGGIPGMILYAFFIFYPLFKMIKNKNMFLYSPFILSHLAMVIFLLTLSFGAYKTIWALWAIMAMVTINKNRVLYA